MDKRIDKIWTFFMNLFATTCHQKSERSFFLGNYQFPLCARCTGLLFGYILGIILSLSKKQFSLIINFLFLIIMFLDWFLQYKKIKMSTNIKRFFTGTLCGIGIVGIIHYLIKLIF